MILKVTQNLKQIYGVPPNNKNKNVAIKKKWCIDVEKIKEIIYDYSLNSSSYKTSIFCKAKLFKKCNIFYF